MYIGFDIFCYLMCVGYPKSSGLSGVVLGFCNIVILICNYCICNCSIIYCIAQHVVK